MTREFPGLLSLALITLGGMGLLPAQPAAPPEPTVLVEIQNPAAPASTEMARRADLCDGARVVLVYPDGRRVTVSEGFQSACEPDVSYDGRKILFSGKASPESSWNIFEFEIGSGTSRQITRDAGNCRSPIYLSTYYIITANDPWLQILFVSDAARETDESGSGKALALYSCQLDGSEINRITFNPSSDQDPFLCWDGRILFSSRRAGTPERGNGQTKIFNMNVDGTDLVAFSGQQGAPVQRMPTVTTSSLAVFVESDTQSGDGGGTLGSVSLRRPMHTYSKLTDPMDGIFFSPAPLPDGSLLVSWKSSPAAERYELVRMDPETGSVTPWLSDSGKSLLYGRVVEARPQPDGRSSVVNENHPFGQFYCLNIGINDLQDGDLLRTAARRVRVLEGLPVHSGTASPPSGPPLLPKRILGEVPLEADGSVFFEVPANTPVQLQLIDEDGMALRSCEWIWVRNKEPRGCIGCHEDGELVPDNRLVDAVRRPPVSLTAPAHLRRYVDFRRDVLPLIASGCASAACHNGQSSGPDLHPPDGNGASAEYADRVYAVLNGSTGGGRENPGRRWIDPGRARTSPLIWHITGKNTSMPWDKLPAAQAAISPILSRPKVEPKLSRVLIEWIDLGAHGGSQVDDAVQTALQGLSGGDE